MNFIVACHVLQYYDNELAWWFNCGVQIFICISGFLYGQRRIDNGYSFIKRRFIKILSSYYVCLLIDVVLLYIFSDQVVDIKDIILMVFCKGTIAGLGHLWFVGTILFCYLLTPILSQVYEFQNRKNFKMEFFSFCVCLCIVVQIHLPQFNPIWILCYICGYSIGKLKLKDEKWLYKASLLFVPTSIIFNIVKIYMKYVLKITLKNDALNWLYARYGNLCHLLLGVSLFLILYVIYLYLPMWGNALCADRKELDVLGVGAYDGEKLVGLAACSADCDNMWQIGVDVLPEYRRMGIASSLTSNLAIEIIERGKVPFYCCAWSNLKSVKNALRSGFVPGWVEMTVKAASLVDEMNK